MEKKAPENIAELLNFYIDKGVPPIKLYEALREYKIVKEAIGKQIIYEEVQRYFKKRFRT